MTHPITPTPLDDDNKPGFSATATKLERLNEILVANVDRYAELLARKDPFAVIRDQTLQIEYLARQINTVNEEFLKSRGLADRLELHRHSINMMAINLKITPRRHFIRRWRIQRQLADILIKMAEDFPTKEGR
jgi:hypothetical protein